MSTSVWLFYWGTLLTAALDGADSSNEFSANFYNHFDEARDEITDLIFAANKTGHLRNLL